MRRWIKTACVFALISCFGHFYLAKRAYQLSAGFAEKSAICQISEKINCDQALLSPYAKIFNFSISDFGFAFNLTLFVLLLFMLKFNLSPYWKNLLFYISGFMALSSVVMSIISLLYHLYCPVCWSLYIFSFIILASLFFALKSNLMSPLNFILTAVKEKSFYFLGVVIFLCAGFLHISFINAYDIKDQNELIFSLLEDWQYEPTVEVPPHHVMEKGNENSPMVLVEFADLLCPACKRTHRPLKKFLKNFPDVKFYFFVYPLDSACNDSISFSRSGLSCELSKALICAKDKSWEFKDYFFKKQEQFISAQGLPKKVTKLMDEIINKTQLNKAQFETCMKKESTSEKVKLSAQAGHQVKIKGTPSFLINGKKLISHDAQLVLLQKIYQYLKSQ
ncbi:MAG: thioredoxin domain-containing protein [Bdellovibrionaceae bacterium]|nr:thioredoxin domain-containing protein [Pseudobdellovibrionaceae bacterium]